MWKKTNHGGEPTKNKDKKYAIFVGRFQPYHYGHIKLVQQKLEEGVGALILVRDIQPDTKNPFTTHETVSMIESYHEISGDDVQVKVIPDIESVNYGRGVGYEINEFVPPKDVGFISATKIRECVANKDDSWKDLVPTAIHEELVTYLNNNTHSQ